MKCLTGTPCCIEFQTHIHRHGQVKQAKAVVGYRHRKFKQAHGGEHRGRMREREEDREGERRVAERRDS